MSGISVSFVCIWSKITVPVVTAVEFVEAELSGVVTVETTMEAIVAATANDLTEHCLSISVGVGGLTMMWRSNVDIGR